MNLPTRPKIVVLDGFTLNPGDLDWKALEEIGDLTVHDRTPPEETVARLAVADIALTNKAPIRAADLEQLPALRYIGVLAIAGAGLDVLSVEPPRANNPLPAARNCLITPHIAWATLEARRRLMAITVSNVRHFLEGTPENLIRP